VLSLVKTDKLEPELPDLREGEVHVWYAALDRYASFTQQYYRTLSADEQSRAERFRFERDKNHFIAARGLLREILRHYLHTTPEEISFCYNPQGKPALQNHPDNQNLMFNVSHSHGMALYAITQKKNIGIDVEQIRNDVEADKIATRFFSEQEASILYSLPIHLKTRGFYNCWTRKEAYLKARGEGLMTPLSKFSVSLTPGKPAALINCQWDPDETSRWTLHELNVDHRYIAALAVEGIPANITCRPWRI